MLKIVAIDGTWLMHRAFHVRPESVQYMVLGWVCRFAFLRKATHVVVCFDSGRSFRHDIYDGYKASRKPGKLGPDIPKATRALLAKAGIGHVNGGVFEADDLLNTIGNFPTLRQSGVGCHVDLVTPDKDNLQGISSSCTVIRPGVSGKEDAVWTPAVLAREEHGLTPRQYLDHQTLLGDKTDCIPQLMTKMASVKLVKAHGSLKNFLLADESGFARKFKAEIIRNRKLVTLLKDCVELDLEEFDVRNLKKGLDFKNPWYRDLTEKRRGLF